MTDVTEKEVRGGKGVREGREEVRGDDVGVSVRKWGGGKRV